MAKKKTSAKREFTAAERRYMETFGAALVRRRKQLDYSQEEFAHLAGMHPAYVGGVERGERNLSLLNIEKLCNALDMSAADLFKEANL